jgi:hypothetical protein
VSTADQTTDTPAYPFDASYAANGYDVSQLHLGIFAALASEFSPREVKTRSQAGRTFSYVTARSVMNRLDDVLGPTNWWDRYVPGENGVLCELTIRLPDGSILTKCDVGGYAAMQDEGDNEKSGVSDAIKRAAIKLGVGRYLYRDGVPSFALDRYEFENVAPEPGPAPHRSAPVPQPQRGSWGGGQGQPQRGGDDRDAEYAASRPAPQDRPSGGGGGNGGQKAFGVPKTGKALFAWCKDAEQKYEVGILKYLTNWAKLQEFPQKMVDYSQEEVEFAYREGVRKLQSIGHGDDSREEAMSNS